MSNAVYTLPGTDVVWIVDLDGEAIEVADVQSVRKVQTEEAADGLYVHYGNDEWVGPLVRMNHIMEG